MSKTEKVVNYTTEQTAEIVAAYLANPAKGTVEALAVQFGKTSRSIVAKLSREGVYKKAVYVSKTGAKPVRKNEIVCEIAKAIGIDADKLDGMEAATKNALLLILASVKNNSVAGNT